MTLPTITIVIPTYRRPDVLRQCLQKITQQDSLDQCDVRIYDNGAPHDSQSVASEYQNQLNLTYTLNEPGHGFGYSVSRGSREATGDIIVELNDDALVPHDLIPRIRSLFQQDERIGIVGVRAEEEGYHQEGEGIGRIDASHGLIANFNRPTQAAIDVDHIYGFCYAYRRELLSRGAVHDNVLLAKDYSSGNRIETDHCLTARKLGYRVLYDGSLVVTHLAKPRGDLDEWSARWKINQIRNTLYLYLKHFGWLGQRRLALRYMLIHDVGILSLLRRPNYANLVYFFTGLRARLSAVAHWCIFRLTRRALKPLETNKEPDH